MKIEDQVCSLEHAKKLKELCVEQSALYNWVTLDMAHPLYNVHVNTRSKERVLELLNGVLIHGDDPYKKMCGEFIHYSAFTVAELMNMIPHEIKDPNSGYEHDPYMLKLWREDKGYLVSLVKDGGYNADYIANEIASEKLSDALALMLRHLLENNLIKL